jgi:hypothetical protein
MLMGHACILGALDATSKMAADLFSDKVPPSAPVASDAAAGAPGGARPPSAAIRRVPPSLPRRRVTAARRGAQEGEDRASWRETFVASSTAAASAVTPVGGYILKERILKA